MSNNLIERKPYMQILRNLKEQRLIKVITGIRRSGKSTLLEMFAQEILQTTTNAQVQFLNFEDLDTLAIGDYLQVHKYISEKLVPDKMNYIFLDEVQNIANFERMVDSLYIKKNVDLYITGSNAYMLSGELATLLTGRYVETHVLPFSFSEYLSTDIANPQKFAKNESFADLTKSKEELLLDFIYNGALPQAVSMRNSAPHQENDFVKAVLNTIIEKDIFTRREIYNKPTFNKIVDFVFDSVGSPVSPNSISKTLKSEKTIVNNETVANYLNYLSQSYLLLKFRALM